MRLFRFLFGFDLLALLSLAWFFVDGLRYSPGVDYMSLWFPILVAPGGVLVAAWVLRAKGRTGLANGLLGVLAVPFLLYLLFVAMFVLFPPDFR